MKLRSVIFDLDGTLIDSAPSILASMQAAFDEAGIRPTRPLSDDLIGPPLAQTLTSVLGDDHADRLSELIERFKRHYDEAGYRSTRVYDGVHAMLQRLHQQNLHLYIATNKRILPTRRIVQHLGWEPLFRGLFALDYYTPPLPAKSAMLQRLRDELRQDASDLVYVGDRAEDAEAARISGIPFLWAAWGYGGDLGSLSPETTLTAPDQLLRP